MDVYAFLADCEIPYQRVDHSPIFNVAEAEEKVPSRSGSKPPSEVDPGEGWARNDSATVGAWRSGLVRVDQNDEHGRDEGHTVVAVNGEPIAPGGEVITAFGRTGPLFACEEEGIVPDLMTTAKGLTSGYVPMGAVFMRDHVYETIADGAGAKAVGHGFTYSAHPVACAAGLATLDLLKRENLIQQSAELAPKFEAALHGLKGTKHIVDIRNCGLAGALQIAPRDGDAVIRPFEAGMALWKAGFYVRFGGDTLQFGPTFNAKMEDLDRVFNAVGDVLNQLD